MHDLSEERIAACLADASPPPVGRSAHGGELVRVHSSVGVILGDARSGDQPWCALVRGQDHDEVDKALARHDLRHGMQTGELVLIVVPQARCRIDDPEFPAWIRDRVTRGVHARFATVRSTTESSTASRACLEPGTNSRSPGEPFHRSPPATRVTRPWRT
jgi:hypothetical protein